MHCRFAAEVSCKAGQSLALCSAGDDLRAKSRHFILCAPKRRLRAAVLASSRKACGAARLRGGPEGYWQGQVRHPSVGFAASSPYRGAFQTAVSQKPPLQGELGAPQGADGGGHCRFAAEVSCKAGQSLALCSAGDALRAKSRHFVLCAPKRRLRAAVLASSRKPCGAARLRGGQNRPPYIAAGSGRRYTTGSPHQAQRRADEIIGPCAGGSTPQPSSACHACRPRSCRPFALHCRAGVHARREGLRRRPHFPPKKFSKKTGAGCKIPAGPFVV